MKMDSQAQTALVLQTRPEIITFLQKVLPGPIILFTALSFPGVAYTSCASRIATFGVVVLSSVPAFRLCQVENVMLSYLLGFGTTWFLIWSSVLLLYHNPPEDFRRIRRVNTQDSSSKMDDAAVVYDWEHFPKRLDMSRIYWILDLMHNYRGIGWSFRSPRHAIPDSAKPLYEMNGLQISKENLPLHSCYEDAEARNQVLRHTIIIFLSDYILVDLCTNIMDSDPYFQGLGAPSKTIVPRLIPAFMVMIFRLLISAIGVYSVMDIYHRTVTLIGVGLGPQIAGNWGEHWMFPRLWGSPVAIYNRGLAGFWGEVWHDWFRYAFESHARNIIPQAPKTDTAHSSFRKILRVNIAFLLSGFMHGAGSYTQHADTSPWKAFGTFSLSGIGITLHYLLDMSAPKFTKHQKLRMMALLAFDYVWAYWAFPMFVGDVAIGGGFMIKFIPVSIFGLLLGRRYPGWK